MENQPVKNEPLLLRRVLLGFVVFICLIIAWHLYLSFELKNRVRSLQSENIDSGQELSVSMNPLTNLASITIMMPPDLDEDNPFTALGSALGGALIQSMGPSIIERELNTLAREKFDLYAMLIPYRVRISTEPASKEAIARVQQIRTDEARAKAEAEAERLRSISNYVSSNLSLANVRVSGQRVAGVFGTIVNNGAETFRKVTVRVYFLNNEGRRIGEKDFSPVFVTEFSVGDNTPLRPGYQKDFGYSIGDYAPSGWSNEIEAEIVDVVFMEQ